MRLRQLKIFYKFVFLGEIENTFSSICQQMVDSLRLQLFVAKILATYIYVMPVFQLFQYLL